MKVCKDMQKHDYQRGLQIKLIHIFLLDFFSFSKYCAKLGLKQLKLSIFSKKRDSEKKLMHISDSNYIDSLISQVQDASDLAITRLFP